MRNDLDMPDLPFSKPAAIEKLESMSFEQREAMDPVEVSDRIHEIADSLAQAYSKKFKKADFEKCVGIIYSALNELGFALGGNFGAQMIAQSEKAAEESAKEIFTAEK